MSKGIKILDPNSGQTVYDSTKPRLQVAVDRDPPHLDRQTVTPTQIVTDAGNSFYAREVLFETKHNLGYKPRVLAYFKQSAFGNRYDCGKTFYGFGAFDDYVGYEVDESYFRIVHILNDQFFNNGLTSTATGTVYCKFLIFSNPVDQLTDPSVR